MAFEKFNKDMKIISALDDEPNDVGGLTAAALKAKFDEGGEAIKRYLNDTLIPAVVEDGATEEHRAEAEAARVAAEQTRQSNEETRQANEMSRISAENARSVWESYDASKAYAVGNKVAYGGSSYLCIKPPVSLRRVRNTGCSSPRRATRATRASPVVVAVSLR